LEGQKVSNLAQRQVWSLSLHPRDSCTAKKQETEGKQGNGTDIMVIGSTGFRTFVEEKGDLHTVIKNCREAKIMLLNPYSEGQAYGQKKHPRPRHHP